MIDRPYAYFNTLKNLLLKGKLELSESDKESPEERQKKLEAQKKQQEWKYGYHNAIMDYQHYKEIIEAEAKQAKSSFDEYLKTSPLQGLWQSIVEKLERFKEEKALITAGKFAW